MKFKVYFRASKLTNAVVVNGKEITDMETDELINYINGKPQNKNNHNKNLNKKKKKKKNKEKNQGEFSLIDQNNSRLLEAIGNRLDHYEDSTVDSSRKMSDSSYDVDLEQAAPKIENYINREINEVDVNEFKKRIKQNYNSGNSNVNLLLHLFN